jgi:hypothetical protein
LPIPKKEDVVSHPVIACAAGKILHTTEFSDFGIYMYTPFLILSIAYRKDAEMHV